MKLIDQRIALLRILLIIDASHNVETHMLSCRAKLIKRIDHRLDILDRCQTHDRTDVNPSVFLFQWNRGKPFIVDSVLNDTTFLLVTSHLDLCMHGIGK